MKEIWSKKKKRLYNLSNLPAQCGLSNLQIPLSTPRMKLRD
jgi:hypothetical protein